jgi:hypothetical protein
MFLTSWHPFFPQTSDPETLVICQKTTLCNNPEDFKQQIESCYIIILFFWELILSIDPWFQLQNWNLQVIVRYQENDLIFDIVILIFYV